jgi:hypothetical protein
MSAFLWEVATGIARTVPAPGMGELRKDDIQKLDLFNLPSIRIKRPYSLRRNEPDEILMIK